MHLGSGDISYIPAIVATAAAKLSWAVVYPWASHPSLDWDVQLGNSGLSCNELATLLQLFQKH